MKIKYSILLLGLLLVFFSYSVLMAGDIHEAAKSGDLEKLKLLLANDPSLLYLKDEVGKTPLHWATGRGQIEAIKLLLDTYHVDVNIRNNNEGTPLHVAASQAQPEAARILIAHHALVDAKTKDNSTPLHFAAYKGRKAGHIETAQILLENKADPNAQTYNGATPLFYAIQRNNSEIIALLRKFGAKGGGQQQGRSGMRQNSQMLNMDQND